MTDQAVLHRPLGLTDAVVAHIRDGIVRGRYEPGRPLAEAQLAAELGTSRGTVREALRELAALGLVSRSAHKGAVVTPLTPRAAEEIYTLRAALESFAAQLAVQRGSLDAVAFVALEAHVEAIGRAGVGGDIGGMVQADMDFHWTLSSHAGHSLLMEHLAAIQVHSRRLLVYSDLYRPDARLLVERHQELLEVLRRGDALEVAVAVDVHITEPGRDIVARMRERTRLEEVGVGAA